MNVQQELAKLTAFSDAAACRKLWERVEADGYFPVLQVVQTPRWTLLVAVPWCRFAREINSEEAYRRLIEDLKRTPTAAEVKAPETQHMLF